MQWAELFNSSLRSWLRHDNVPCTRTADETVGWSARVIVTCVSAIGAIFPICIAFRINLRLPFLSSSRLGRVRPLRRPRALVFIIVISEHIFLRRCRRNRRPLDGREGALEPSFLEPGPA